MSLVPSLKEVFKLICHTFNQLQNVDHFQIQRRAFEYEYPQVWNRKMQVKGAQEQVQRVKLGLILYSPGGKSYALTCLPNLTLWTCMWGPLTGGQRSVWPPRTT